MKNFLDTIRLEGEQKRGPLRQPGQCPRRCGPGKRRAPLSQTQYSIGISVTSFINYHTHTHTPISIIAPEVRRASRRPKEGNQASELRAFLTCKERQIFPLRPSENPINFFMRSTTRLIHIESDCGKKYCVTYGHTDRRTHSVRALQSRGTWRRWRRCCPELLGGISYCEINLDSAVQSSLRIAASILQGIGFFHICPSSLISVYSLSKELSRFSISIHAYSIRLIYPPMQMCIQ